jgi:hypothetical protein
MALQRCSAVIFESDVPLLKVRHPALVDLLEDMRLRAYREHQKKRRKIFSLDYEIPDKRTQYAWGRRSGACENMV